MPNPGLSPEILEAMRRRQMGAPAPALNQTSPDAAMANQVQPPAPPSSINQASAPPSAAPVKTPKYQAQNSKEMIVQALIEQLKNDNKLEEQQGQMPPQPAPAAAMGGGGAQYAYQKPMGGGGSYSMSPGYAQPMPKMSMQSDYSQGNYTGLNNYGNGQGF